MRILLFSVHLILGISWLLTICFLMNQICLLALGTLLCLFFWEKMQYIFSQLLGVVFDCVIGVLALFLFFFPLLSLYQYFVNKKTQTNPNKQQGRETISLCLIHAAAWKWGECVMDSACLMWELWCLPKRYCCYCVCERKIKPTDSCQPPLRYVVGTKGVDVLWLK